MARQAFTALTWNGTTVDGSGNILMEIIGGDNSPFSPGGIDPVEALVTGATPQDVRGQRRAAVWQFQLTLTATDETDVSTMLGVFNEEQGLVVFRAKDGQASPVTWLTHARIIQPPAAVFGTRGLFRGAIRVPNPVWEADTVATTTYLNTTNAPAASPATANITPAGNRDAYPVWTFSPDANKALSLNDYKYNRQRFIVSRSPFPGKVPVWLFDDNGVAARIATGTSTAQTAPTVRQDSGTSQTLTADPGAGGTTLALSAVVGFSTSGGMAIIDWVTGSTFGTMEAVSYTGISGSSLTGVTRGIGGTTAQAHSIGEIVQPSGTMPNGDDLRVWLDGVQVNRWLVNWNSTSSDAVINWDMPAQITLTLAQALTASTTGTVRFAESVSKLSGDSGFVAFENEVVHYSAKVGANGLNIDVRGCWGTTAATHAIAVVGYGDPKRVIVAVGKGTADSAPSPASERPALQLVGSNNKVYKWGDESDDASTVFFDRANPNRTMQFQPGFDSDGNDVSPLMSISASNTILTFKDDVPGDGSPPYNFAELTIPQGIDAGNATAIIADWTPSADVLNLEMFSRDKQSVLKLIDQLQQAAAAANRSPASFTNNAYALKLKGRYNVITGWRGKDTVRTTITNANATLPVAGCVAFQFVYSGNRVTSRIQAYLNKTAAGSQDVTCYIVNDASDLPDVSAEQQVAHLTNVAVAGTGVALYEWKLGERSLTKAGTYWAVFFMSTTFTSVDFYGSFYLAGNDRIRAAKQAGASWAVGDLIGPGNDLAVLVTGTYNNEGEALLEPDQPVGTPAAGTVFARTAVTASFDGVEITLEPLQHVYVGGNAAFSANNLYHNQCVVSNATTGDTYTIDLWQKLTASLVIDSSLKTVEYTEDAIVYPVLGAVGSGFKSMRMTAGVVNAMQFYDPALVTGSSGQLDGTLTLRARKV